MRKLCSGFVELSGKHRKYNPTPAFPAFVAIIRQVWLEFWVYLTWNNANGYQHPRNDVRKTARRTHRRSQEKCRNLRPLDRSYVRGVITSVLFSNRVFLVRVSLGALATLPGLSSPLVNPTYRLNKHG